MFRIEWGTDLSDANTYNYANFNTYKEAEDFYNNKEASLEKKYKKEYWINILSNDPEEAQDYGAEYVDEFRDPDSGYETYDINESDTKQTKNEYDNSKTYPFTIYLYTDTWDDEFKKLEHHFEYLYEGNGNYSRVQVINNTDEDDPNITISGEISNFGSRETFDNDLQRGLEEYEINDYDIIISHNNLDEDNENKETIAERLAKELKDYVWAGDEADGPEGTICNWDIEEINDSLPSFLEGYCEDAYTENIQTKKINNDTLEAKCTFKDKSIYKIILKNIRNYACVQLGNKVNTWQEVVDDLAPTLIEDQNGKGKINIDAEGVASVLKDSCAQPENNVAIQPTNKEILDYVKKNYFNDNELLNKNYKLDLVDIGIGGLEEDEVHNDSLVLDWESNKNEVIALYFKTKNDADKWLKKNNYNLIKSKSQLFISKILNF